MTIGRRIKPNNKGFSLVELIVVILILGILTGGTAITISVLYNARVDNAARRLHAMLDKAREEAMAHIISETGIEIYDDAGNIYARINVDGEEVAKEKLGNKNISVTFLKRRESDALEDAVPEKVEADNTITIFYNAANGGIKSMDEADGKYYYTDVTLEGSDTRRLIIIPETGRVLDN